jgi:hypothetical protein
LLSDYFFLENKNASCDANGNLAMSTGPNETTLSAWNARDQVTLIREPEVSANAAP